MEQIEALRSQALALPPLAKFAAVIAVMVGVPALAHRVGMPEMVGLLLFGVVLAPHVLGTFGEDRPTADFFAELGKLLLMFSAGLESDVALFRNARTRGRCGPRDARVSASRLFGRTRAVLRPDYIMRVWRLKRSQSIPATMRASNAPENNIRYNSSRRAALRSTCKK
jgi:hypothetical protein